ncbi:hypothetical protein NPIL_642271 [Nephila pilipes]|uniref:Uncharacterized protein n=1 Tax=Nephila pilipes TaxID=299642 RepID=A0A8X6PWA6_NEPPI|nr:hypothetical protein NPIL_642271 [Nephila pilipes]
MKNVTKRKPKVNSFIRKTKEGYNFKAGSHNLELRCFLKDRMKDFLKVERKDHTPEVYCIKKRFDLAFDYQHFDSFDLFSSARAIFQGLIYLLLSRNFLADSKQLHKYPQCQLC